MSTGADPSNTKALTSWKEIAQWFGREVRTVQRWERLEGLPIHRHFHFRRSSIYAYPAELEAWWQARGSRLSEKPKETTRAWRSSWRLWAAVSGGALLVALVLMIARFLPRSETTWPGNLKVVSFETSHTVGRLAIALLGDVNGDGFDDLIVSADLRKGVNIRFGGGGPLVGGQLPSAANVVITHSPDFTSVIAAQVADFNGDGLADLLIDADLTDPAYLLAAAPGFLLWGRREWPSQISLPDQADVILRFDWKTEARNFSCNAAGKPADLNGDGIPDVLLGAYRFGDENRNGMGSLYVLFGRRQWPRELEVKAAADITLKGARHGEGFGRPCAVGDFNGDKRPDLAVYAWEGELWNLLGSRGRVYVFLGRERWPKRIDALSDFDFRVDGQREKSDQPSLLLADVNGDGRDDLVAAWFAVRNDSSYPGEIRIWLGSEGRRGITSSETADVVISGSQRDAQLGSALAASDLDSDGIADLVVSQPGRGEMLLLYGRPKWESRGILEEFAPVRLYQGKRGTGTWNVGAGDFDGDGLVELAFIRAGGEGKPGQAWLLKPYSEVRVDLRPDSEPNLLLYPSGVFAARIYGYSHAERDQIDPSTVRLAGAAPLRHVVRDENGDGIPDLAVQFYTSKLAVSPTTTRLSLTGRTRGGMLVGGGDSVQVVLNSEDPVRSTAGSRKNGNR